MHHSMLILSRETNGSGVISLLTDLERFAAEKTDAPAIASPTGELSFGQLERSVRGVAQRLRAEGIGPRNLVAIDLPAAQEWVIDLALLRIAARGMSVRGIGGAGDASPAAVICSAGGGAVLAPLTVRVDDAWIRDAAAEASAAGALIEYARPDSICRVMLTSGTTGTPRAAAYSVAALEHRRLGLHRYWTDDRPELNLMGLSTTGGLHTAVAALAHGQAFRAADRIDAESMRFAAAEGIEVLCGSPMQIGLALEVLREHDIALPALREVRIAGATPSPALLRSIADRLGVPVRSVYGSTEGGGVTMRMLGPDDDAANVGEPLPGLDVRIGEAGRVQYRGAGMVSGYLEGDRVIPFAGGWFEPGDVGSFDEDGSLVLAGRETELVNVAGTKIDPARVDALAREMPGVIDAAAFGVERRAGIPELAIALVTQPDCDLRALDRMMRQNLRFGYPTVYWRTGAIPRNRMGKPERAALVQEFLKKNGAG